MKNPKNKNCPTILMSRKNLKSLNNKCRYAMNMAFTLVLTSFSVVIQEKITNPQEQLTTIGLV